MQGSVRISPLVAVALVALPAILALLAGLSGSVTGGDDGAQAAEGYRGNVDCDGGIDSGDVLSLLGAVSGARGAPRNCVDYDGYTNHGCIPPSIPNPTACDMVWPNWITLAPGETLPERYDIDCDSHTDTRDVLRLLIFIVGFPEPLPTCLPTGNPT